MRNSILLFLASAFFLSACSNDDNLVQPDVSQKLIGNWIATTLIVEGEVFPYDGHEDCGFDVLQFNTESLGRYTDIFECEEIATVFEYKVVNESIEIQFGNTTMVGSIIAASEEILSLELEYDFDDDGDTEFVIENYETGISIF
ncbi:MAG: hypothetical protein WBG90_15795 [Saonia sp.]